MVEKQMVKRDMMKVTVCPGSNWKNNEKEEKSVLDYIMFIRKISFFSKSIKVQLFSSEKKYPGYFLASC